MDKLSKYRTIIGNILNQYAGKPSHGKIDSEIIIDTEQNHFELMHVGWDGTRRVHGSVLHIDIIGDNIWIQHDGTSCGVAKDLVEAGIPRENIVLGFGPPHVRKHTGYNIGKESVNVYCEANKLGADSGFCSAQAWR